MHIYIPPRARSDLRTWTTYVNTLPPGTILRLRTFRLFIGIKSHIVPLDELRLVRMQGAIPAFESNVEWVAQDWRSRTPLLGKKAWFLHPGYGGQEMDVFWRRVGMEENVIKESRDRAVEKMKDYVSKREKGLKKVFDAVQGSGGSGMGKKGRKMERKGDKNGKKKITLD